MKNSTVYDFIIPEPQKIILHDESFSLPESFSLNCPDQTFQKILAKELPDIIFKEKSGFPVEVLREAVPETNKKDSEESNETASIMFGKWHSSEELYKIDVRSKGFRIYAQHEQGLRCACRTFRQILQEAEKQAELCEATIFDFPDFTRRGVFIEDKWGPDLMTLTDWQSMIDSFADMKFNTLIVGLYGGWSIQYNNKPTEFLMERFELLGHIKTEWEIEYYLPSEGKVVKKQYLPEMYEKHFFADVIKYAISKGIEVIPLFNTLGHSTLIPRNFPELSAKDEKGKPTNYGFCLANGKTLEFFKKLYHEIIEKYMRPFGLDTIHLGLDEILPMLGINPNNPSEKINPWCACTECRKLEKGKHFINFVIEICNFLKGEGIKEVIIWNDQITRHDDFMNDFVTAIKENKLEEMLNVNWWWYRNYLIPQVDMGKAPGLKHSIMPMGTYFNWSHYTDKSENIELLLDLAYRRNAEEVYAYSVYDPGLLHVFSFLGERSWNFRGTVNYLKFTKKFCQKLYTEDAEKTAKAISLLRDASESSLNRQLGHFIFSYAAQEQPYPRNYPDELLEKLKSNLTKNISELKMIMEKSTEALDKLESSSEKTRKSPAIKGLSFYADRLRVLSSTILALLENNTNVSCSEIESLMEKGEKSLPHYWQPSILRDLTPLHTFLKNNPCKIEAKK